MPVKRHRRELCTLRHFADRETGQPVTIQYRPGGGENSVSTHAYTVHSSVYGVHTRAIRARDCARCLSRQRLWSAWRGRQRRPEEPINTVEALGLIEQRRVASLRNGRPLESRMLLLHSRHGLGTEEIRQLAAQREHRDLPQRCPKWPEVARRARGVAQDFADHRVGVGLEHPGGVHPVTAPGNSLPPCLWKARPGGTEELSQLCDRLRPGRNRWAAARVSADPLQTYRVELWPHIVQHDP